MYQNRFCFWFSSYTIIQWLNYLFIFMIQFYLFNFLKLFKHNNHFLSIFYNCKTGLIWNNYIQFASIPCFLMKIYTYTKWTQYDPCTGIPFLAAELCPNCIIGRNWGYKSVPGDCTKFIQMLPDADGNALEFTHACPWGQFWNLNHLTCEPSHEVYCPDSK